MSHKVIGVEDCLVVNVYVPGDVSARKNDDDLLPVMFWIHGGGFFIGSGNTDFYGPERFMDYGVVRNRLNVETTFKLEGVHKKNLCFPRIKAFVVQNNLKRCL